MAGLRVRVPPLGFGLCSSRGRAGSRPSSHAHPNPGREAVQHGHGSGGPERIGYLTSQGDPRRRVTRVIPGLSGAHHMPATALVCFRREIDDGRPAHVSASAVHRSPSAPTPASTATRPAATPSRSTTRHGCADSWCSASTAAPTTRRRGTSPVTTPRSWPGWRRRTRRRWSRPSSRCRRRAPPRSRTRRCSRSRWRRRTRSPRELALAALPKVARTGTHLFLFAAYVEQFRGWGRGLRRAVGSLVHLADADAPGLPGGQVPPARGLVTP